MHCERLGSSLIKIDFCNVTLFCYNMTVFSPAWYTLCVQHVAIVTGTLHSVVMCDLYIFPCLPVGAPPNVAKTDGSGEGDVLSQRVTGECKKYKCGRNVI